MYALSQIIDLLANDTDGIHLYTMNNPVVARKICEGIQHIYDVYCVRHFVLLGIICKKVIPSTQYTQ